MTTLEEELADLDAGLASVILAIARGSAAVAETLRTASVHEVGTSNALGDKQLVADIEADARIIAELTRCGAVAVASSEEQPTDIELSSTGGYSVAYDPLDGSSIIGANWAVGSIFGVWPGKGFVNRRGRDQIAAAYAVHGPKTTLILARPRAPSQQEQEQTSSKGLVDVSGEDASSSLSTITVVQEFVLVNNQWQLARNDIKVAPEKKVFAPANLRASSENAAYAELVQYWMKERYTLRYSGGMVPDVHHILAKGGGVFCNPSSLSSPAKLRVLYECFPLAFIMEAAGGASSHNGRESMLELSLKAHDHRSTICLGSELEVVKCLSAMQL